MNQPKLTWFDRLTGRRALEVELWARAEVERTRSPVCDRDACYSDDSAIANASRIEHGCTPDWTRP
jgi:hypothetical protein